MRPVRLHHLSVALLLAAAGCATLPELQPRSVQTAFDDVALTPLARIANAAAPADKPALSGFRLLPSGESAFNARIALARRAVRSLDVQYYILADDATGRGFLRELRNAAQRGVRVRLLVDDLHAAGEEDLLTGLAAYPNVQVRLFNPLPVRGGSFGVRLLLSLRELGRINHRMHNKLFVADNSFAVAGGRNMADEYFMHSTEANFIDLDVLASGPVVRELSAVFDDYWNSQRAYPIEQLVPQPPAQRAREQFEAIVSHATVRLGERQRDPFGNPSVVRQIDSGELSLVYAPARVYADTPDKATDSPRNGLTVAEQALALLASAREEVRISSPYFIPGDKGMAIVRALGASEGNGRVTLLTNSFGATDEPLAYAAYARYRLDLLKAGVRILEVSPALARESGLVGRHDAVGGRLHTKSMAIDRHWLFVGSMNLDPRSALANTEIGLAIDSPALAQQFERLTRLRTEFGAYRLQLSADGERIEWVTTDRQGRRTVLASEPDDDPWLRLKLWLLQPFVSEDML